MAVEVNSLPLSLTIIFGLPRSATSRSSSRTTRTRDSDVSASWVRHSRVQSSTTVRMNAARGPLVLASEASHFYTNMKDGASFPIVLNLGNVAAG